MLASGNGGVEALKELVTQQDSTSIISKSARKTPTLFKVGGIAAIPVSAILGAVVTPSRRMAASAVGSAITGVAGYIGKNRLDAATEVAALPAIAQVIVENDGVENPESIASTIKDLQEAFGVQDEDFTDMCVDVYKKYIIGMVETPITQTSEIKELANLRIALSLNNLSVGTAHAGAAKDFFKKTVLFATPEDLDDPDHPDRMSLDKFLFLSERVFRQGGETNEAFKYEMSRVAKAFDIKMGAALERVAEVSEPFYVKALASTRSKLDSGAVSADMLSRARGSLGIDEYTAADLHLSTYSEEVRSLLGKEEGAEQDPTSLKFESGSLERLAKLQEVLGIEDREANYEIYSEATPLFHAKALTSMNNAMDSSISPEQAWKEMKERQDELLLQDEAMKELLASIVVQALGKPLEDTMVFAKVNNEGATYEKLVDALDAKAACIAVLKQSGWDEFDDFESKFCDPASKDSACGFLSATDRLRLYKIMLTRAVRQSESGKELTDEAYEQVKEVQGLLGIREEDAMSEFRRNFGPELQKALNMAMFEIIGDDYTPELVTNLKEIIDKVIVDYKLTDELVSEFAAPIYARAVNAISDKTPAGVPTKESMGQLHALRDLLGMSEEDTFSAHLDVFGGAYKSATLETMGTTGIIRPEFRQSLIDLRSRLGVSEEAARSLFLEAAEERMIPMVEWIVLELERTMLTAEQLAQKRQKDFGEDYFKTGKGASGTLGLGSEANIMTDCMNLVDFYTENDIPEEKEIGTKTIEKKVQEGEETKTVKEEVPDHETVYPITGLESGSIQEDIAELLFRQFVVGGFTAKQGQGERYEAARSTFGGIIGLSKEKQEEIADSIGGQVYENYISNSMRTKGQLDQQDMMFLANIQAKLNIAEESSEKMLLDTQKKLLSEEANAILQNDPTPEMIKTFREKCNSMGMELESDVGINSARIADMFEAEVSPGLAKGDITTESADLLSEIQDSLGLTPEEAEKIFERILDERAQGAMKRIKGEILRGREDNCVDIIERLVRYSRFVNGEFDLDVEEATAWKTFNLYESMDFEGVDPETVEENKSVLKTALGLN